MKVKLLTLAAVLFATVALAAPTNPAAPPSPTAPIKLRETDWSGYLAERKFLGEAEARLPDGSRVDILAQSIAWEVEWINKWPEAVGQSLFYAISSDRNSGIILLMRKSDATSHKYYLRCKMVCSKIGIRLVVISVKEHEKAVRDWKATQE